MAMKKAPAKNPPTPRRTIDKIKLNDEVFLAAMAIDTGGLDHRATVSLINFTDDTFEMTSTSWEGFRTFSTRNMKYLGKRQWLLCDPWMNLFNSPRPDTEEYKRIKPKPCDKVFDVCRAVRTGHIEVLTEITELTDDGGMRLLNGNTFGRVPELLETKMLRYLANNVWLMDFDHTSEQWKEKNKTIDEQKKVIKGLNEQMCSNNAEIVRLKARQRSITVREHMQPDDRVVFLSDMIENRMTFQDALLKVNTGNEDEDAVNLYKEPPRGTVPHRVFVPELYHYRFMEEYNAWIVLGRKDGKGDNEPTCKSSTGLIANLPTLPDAPKPDDTVVYMAASVHSPTFGTMWKVEREGIAPGTFAIVSPEGQRQIVDGDHMQYDARTKTWVLRFADQVPVKTVTGKTIVLKKGTEVVYAPSDIADPNCQRRAVVENMHAGDVIEFRWTSGEDRTLFYVGRKQVRYSQDEGSWLIDADMPGGQPPEPKPDLVRGTEVIRITGNVDDPNQRLKAVVHSGDSKTLQLFWLEGPEKGARLFVDRQQVQYHARTGLWFLEDVGSVEAEKAPETAPQAISDPAEPPADVTEERIAELERRVAKLENTQK